MYINYEYTQTDEIDAVETFHETSLQFQRKDTKIRKRQVYGQTNRYMNNFSVLAILVIYRIFAACFL